MVTLLTPCSSPISGGPQLESVVSAFHVHVVHPVQRPVVQLSKTSNIINAQIMSLHYTGNHMSTFNIIALPTIPIIIFNNF